MPLAFPTQASRSVLEFTCRSHGAAEVNPWVRDTAGTRQMDVASLLDSHFESLHRGDEDWNTSS